MSQLSEEELLQELRKRFELTNQALEDYQKVAKELQQVNARLEESEQLKSRFLSNIRNEINNPFASILGLSRQLLKIDQLQPEQVRNVGRLIYSEAFDLNFQLRNIFAAAELEAGETAVQASQIELDELLEDMLATFADLSERQQVALQLKKPGQPVTFCSDAEKIQLILSNLISNAIRFSHEEQQGHDFKQLEVSYRVTGKLLYFTVSDQGIGITEEELPQIFDRFKQLDMGETKTHRGHGLGLSVVRALLESLEGRIEVKSRPGKGSTFTVIIPECEDSQMYASSANEFFFDDGEVF
jgi:signal transduction histidine kinase